jgi:hypothetical protein
MTDLPNNTTPKRWRVTMADKTTRTIEARGFRVEHGALVLVHPAQGWPLFDAVASRVVAVAVFVTQDHLA